MIIFNGISLIKHHLIVVIKFLEKHYVMKICLTINSTLLSTKFINWNFPYEYWNLKSNFLLHIWISAKLVVFCFFFSWNVFFVKIIIHNYFYNSQEKVHNQPSFPAKIPAAPVQIPRSISPDEEKKQKAFIQNLYSFMRARLTPIGRLPHIGNRESNFT